MQLLLLQLAVLSLLVLLPGMLLGQMMLVTALVIMTARGHPTGPAAAPGLGRLPDGMPGARQGRVRMIAALTMDVLARQAAAARMTETVAAVDSTCPSTASDLLTDVGSKARSGSSSSRRNGSSMTTACRAAASRSTVVPCLWVV